MLFHSYAAVEEVLTSLLHFMSENQLFPFSTSKHPYHQDFAVLFLDKNPQNLCIVLDSIYPF